MGADRRPQPCHYGLVYGFRQGPWGRDGRRIPDSGLERGGSPRVHGPGGYRDGCPDDAGAAALVWGWCRIGGFLPQVQRGVRGAQGPVPRALPFLRRPAVAGCEAGGGRSHLCAGCPACGRRETGHQQLRPILGRPGTGAADGGAECAQGRDYHASSQALRRERQADRRGAAGFLRVSGRNYAGCPQHGRPRSPGPVSRPQGRGPALWLVPAERPSAFQGSPARHDQAGVYEAGGCGRQRRPPVL